jgi:hypothetical protein
MNTLHNLQGEAGQLLDALKECSAQANAVSQRWFTLAQLERLTLAQAAYAQLEVQVLTCSRRLASLRQCHATCTTRASAHEDAPLASAAPLNRRVERAALMLEFTRSIFLMTRCRLVTDGHQDECTSYAAQG